MTEATQSKIYQTVTSSDQRVWINLAHVRSVVLLSSDDEPSIIRVALSNNDCLELKNEPSEIYTMWADQFLFALNSFHNQTPNQRRG